MWLIVGATLAAAIELALLTRMQARWRVWRLLGLPAVVVASAIWATDVGHILGHAGVAKVALICLITAPISLAAWLVCLDAEPTEAHA